jgi:hypothetical protein
MNLIRLAVVAMCLGSSAFASVYPKTLHGESLRDGGAKKFQYYGGPVIGHARVMTVFWGSKVNASIQSAMPVFYQGVVNSTYLDWLNQYDTNVNAVDGRAGTNQTVGRGSYGGTFTIRPSHGTAALVTDDQIQAELEDQIVAGNLPAATADTLYMIHFPAGLKITMSDGNGGTAASCQQYCAYHFGFASSKLKANVYYGVMPDLSSFACSMGCGMGLGLVDRTTVSSSHELIEAITDAFPTPGNTPGYPQAWNTVDGSEIGDVCQGSNGKLQIGAKVFTVQQEFDNLKGSCTTGDYQSSYFFF